MYSLLRLNRSSCRCVKAHAVVLCWCEVYETEEWPHSWHRGPVRVMDFYAFCSARFKKRLHPHLLWVTVAWRTWLSLSVVVLFIQMFLNGPVVGVLWKCDPNSHSGHIWQKCWGFALCVTLTEVRFCPGGGAYYILLRPTIGRHRRRSCPVIMWLLTPGSDESKLEMRKQTGFSHGLSTVPVKTDLFFSTPDLLKNIPNRAVASELLKAVFLFLLCL